MSEAHIKTAPHKKPDVATRKAGAPPRASALSMAGCSSDQKLAATMTPAEKPSIRFSAFVSGVLKKTTVAAPRAVTSQVPSVAANAIIMTSFISHPLYTAYEAVIEVCLPSLRPVRHDSPGQGISDTSIFLSRSISSFTAWAALFPSNRIWFTCSMMGSCT